MVFNYDFVQFLDLRRVYDMYSINGSWEETPHYVDLNGKPIKRTPQDSPYSYDEFVIWQDKTADIHKCSAVYSDRMMQWNSTKFQHCMQTVFGTSGQSFYNSKHTDINKFLNLYFENKVQLVAVLQGCNVSTGYPYWIFYYM